MKIALSIDINNTPEKVFPWLDNPEKAMEWMSSVTKTEILHETTDMIGTTFRETVEENGQGTEMQGTITDFRPNQLIAFHLSGKYNTVDVEYRLETGGNSTRLTQNADIRFKPFYLKILSILIGPAFRKKILEQSQKEFARLKELCEGSNP